VEGAAADAERTTGKRLIATLPVVGLEIINEDAYFFLDVQFSAVPDAN